MTVLETLIEEQRISLEDAQNKVTVEMLNSLENGEEKTETENIYLNRLKEQYKALKEKQTVDSWSSNKMYYDAMRLFCLDTQLISFNDIELMEFEINSSF